MDNTKKQSIAWPAAPGGRAPAASEKPGIASRAGDRRRPADSSMAASAPAANPSALLRHARADVAPEWLEMFAELRF